VGIERIATVMTEESNKPDAPNPAMTPQFHAGSLRRRVGDLGRSAK
jgi:hypothetical protein